MCSRIYTTRCARSAFEEQIHNLQHRVDPAVPIEETFTTLEELRLAGKIKHIGMSECSIESMRKAIKVRPFVSTTLELTIAQVAKVEYLQIERVRIAHRPLLTPTQTLALDSRRDDERHARMRSRTGHDRRGLLATRPRCAVITPKTERGLRERRRLLDRRHHFAHPR